MKIWEKRDIDLIDRMYKKYPVKIIASVMALKPGQVDGALQRNGIHSGRTGCFQSGHIPWNKGKMVSNTGSEKTQFKKGRLPHNTKPEGYEFFRTSPGKIGYWYIKAGKMQLKHRWLWEQAYGPIPQNHTVIFIDGDTNNCCIENFKLISRQENLRRNYNKQKGSESLKLLYRREKIRKLYGLPPISKLQKRIVNY